MPSQARHAPYWLIVLPALAMLVVLYFVPLIDVLFTSVTDPKPGLANYELLFTSASVQKTLLTTLRIAAVTTFFALLLGYLVAYVMRAAASRRQRLMLFCVLLPFWISVLVRSFAWIALLGTQGPLNQALLGGGKVLMVAEYVAVQINDTLRWGLGTMLAATLMAAVLAGLWLMSRVVDVRRLFGA